jgi:hypothetical protein
MSSYPIAQIASRNGGQPHVFVPHRPDADRPGDVLGLFAMERVAGSELS